MPSDLLFKTMNTLHRGALKLTGGRVGWRASGMTVLELTTTGRKSGQPRTVMLTSPIQQGDTVVVVASRGGDDQNPSGFLNLRDNPDVEVVIGGKPKQHMHARVASPDERAQLWPEITSAHANYAGYQTKTTREIPLVLLDPVAAP
jgi:deazaflavin-dependent oxidoreductase (nitroreductase family)